jgi:oligopeptide transport system ATP-binding protein
MPEAADHASAPGEPLLELRDLEKRYPLRAGALGRTRGYVHAVDGVSFAIRAGETLGLVGESGCGKTTVGKTAVRLEEPTGGRVLLQGRDITHLPQHELRPLRRQIQMVFQDPYLSLSPRMSAASIVAEPLENYGWRERREREANVVALLDRVGLGAEHLRKRPHEFSGGQRQRLGLARALALNPSLIIADEPVSALDVSVQAQIINLLVDLQKEYRLAYLFISHDLAVVEHICHRVAVMYLGKVVELTTRRSLFTTPLHPYTESLLAAVPVPDPATERRRALLEGDVPSPSNPPPGCRFHTRCPYVVAECRVREPPLVEVRPDHLVACHLHRPATPPRRSTSWPGDRAGSDITKR